MKKIGILLIVSMLLLIGCSSKVPFEEVDKPTRDSLLDLLQSAAHGGRGEHIINVEGEVGTDIVSDVSGQVDGSFSNAEMISLGFLDSQVIEISRGDVSPEGEWGPLTVINGPKALVLVENGSAKGYYVHKARYAAALAGGTTYDDFIVNPRDTGLVALALIHSGKLQAAADLLAGIQNIHPTLSGLPAAADIFGRPQGDEVDYTATAWAGYAAAVLAKRASDNQDIWREAEAYASYLEAVDVPEDNEARLAGWLLFTELGAREPSYTELAEKWQLVPGDTYDPLVGTWMLMAGKKIKGYVDSQYSPTSPTDRWIHYNLLAALNKLPEELELGLEEVPGGLAIVYEGKISLQASSWMVIALEGALRH